MSRPTEQALDSALRADVRLLGDTLGQVLVEQEASRPIGLEERIRGLARRGRRGDAEASPRSRDRRRAPGRDPGGRPAGVHDVLPPREHRRAASPRPTASRGRAGGRNAARVARRGARAARRGRGRRGGARAAAAGVSVELVLTAHPTEALRARSSRSTGGSRSCWRRSTTRARRRASAHGRRASSPRR